MSCLLLVLLVLVLFLLILFFFYLFPSYSSSLFSPFILLVLLFFRTHILFLIHFLLLFSFFLFIFLFLPLLLSFSSPFATYALDHFVSYRRILLESGSFYNFCTQGYILVQMEPYSSLSPSSSSPSALVASVADCFQRTFLSSSSSGPQVFSNQHRRHHKGTKIKRNNKKARKNCCTPKKDGPEKSSTLLHKVS